MRGGLHPREHGERAADAVLADIDAVLGVHVAKALRALYRQFEDLHRVFWEINLGSVNEKIRRAILKKLAAKDSVEV
jgi:hypothetical protein